MKDLDSYGLVLHLYDLFGSSKLCLPGLSVEGQKPQRFDQKYLYLRFERLTKVKMQPEFSFLGDLSH